MKSYKVFLEDMAASLQAAVADDSAKIHDALENIQTDNTTGLYYNVRTMQGLLEDLHNNIYGGGSNIENLQESYRMIRGEMNNFREEPSIYNMLMSLVKNLRDLIRVSQS